jgi:hypothetical protein
MCQTIEDATIRTEEGRPSVQKATHFDRESGETLRRNVYQDIVQILSAPFDSVPKIHLWI